MNAEHYQTGMPSWTDLFTDDPLAAIKFYSGLFGWESEPDESGEGPTYYMQKIGDDKVSAIMGQVPDKLDRGIPPHWNTYVTVEDLSGTVNNVPGSGGAVTVEPFQVGDAGRMAVVKDSTNAPLILWQPGTHHGAEVRGVPNALFWSELMTNDVQSAAGFFVDLFRADLVDDIGASGNPYVMMRINGHRAAGFLPITQEMGEMRSSWTSYFRVEDLCEALRRVEELGGESSMPTQQALGFQFTIVADPQGAVFGLIQSDDRAQAS